ncbi:cyclodeaminase/cyclohydrolase family protein [Caldisericum exile]|uniref:Methenyltetrahydrofolate cyclohydrolase n=1 Tax=Caldisericum exile (strain DSM 21853 / NBRC 104410 / AZM16c01) TaxID=511051 RepID=A0A7U6JF05_CALEA|nr:cyclodeaminase/cyclohydrolase family protein [Caldisericum exile]BAL80988.1 putative methenyltetrahydrofolate cyclohydrolase [Caldisericum exile AZM16c01]
MFSDLPLEKFIEELSSSNPTPGGGAASSLVGAFGFALVSMVLSIYQKKNPESSLEPLIEQTKEKSDLLLRLSSKDAEVFERFIEAVQLPKDTEEQKEIRKQKMQKALIDSTLVPFEVINILYDGSKVLDQAKAFCPKSAISDLYTALSFFEAAFDGAKANVLINLKSVKDEKFVTDTKSRLLHIENEFKNYILKLKEEIQNNLTI